MYFQEDIYIFHRTQFKSPYPYKFLKIWIFYRYLSMTQCDLQMVGDEFSRKPYALAVQQGSPLKDQLNDA